MISALVGLLADKGLDLLSKAVNGAGEKAVEFIEEKTGIKLTDGDGNPVADLSPEQVVAMETLQSNERVKLKELALEEKKEDHRHIESEQERELSDVSGARDMYEKSGGELQNELARKVFKQTAWIIPALILANVVLLLGAAAGKIDAVVAGGVGNIIGLSIGRFGDERKTILEFCFGGAMSRISRREEGSVDVELKRAA